LSRTTALLQKQIRNPPRKNNGEINQECRGDYPRKECGSEIVSNRISTQQSSGNGEYWPAEHLFDEGPATFVNMTDRHLHAVKIDFLVPNKHCLGA